MKKKYKGEVGWLYQTSFSHIYKIDGFINPTRYRHWCLANGYWCWKNFFEYPWDIILYFKKK